jgi:hypothetical protein
MTRRLTLAHCSCALLVLAVAASATPPPPAGARRPQAAKRLPGPLPAEALALPSDSQVLMGLAVRPFVASSFYKRFSQPGAILRPTSLDALRRECQVDPERDLDQVVVARGRQGEIAILALGRFDRKMMEAAWSRRTPGKVALSLVFPSPNAFALGSASWIGGIARKGAGAGLTANAALMPLVGQVPARTTFWMVGVGDALSLLATDGGKSQAAATLPLGLPALKSIVVTGDVEPSLSLSAVAEAADEKAARGLADTLSGFLALAALQSQRKPALKDLASAVTVTTEGARVRVTARLTDEMLEALLPRPAASGTPPTPGAAPSATPAP